MGAEREARRATYAPPPSLPRMRRGTPAWARHSVPPGTKWSSSSILFFLACFLGATGAKSYDHSYGGGTTQRNWRITCYTCVNVSNNDECNRFAIDRPCPEGGDFCLTLHVMEGLETDRSLLVNKRCASLEDCVGDSTGCTAAYGQTQCVSCCDQPYCNDSVPSNVTNAVFYRSTASGSTVSSGSIGVIWRVAAALIPALKVLTFGGPS